MSNTVGIRELYAEGCRKEVSTLVGSIARKIGLPQAIINTIHTTGSIYKIDRMSASAEKGGQGYA
jgi:hypothetical protein